MGPVSVRPCVRASVRPLLPLSLQKARVKENGDHKVRFSGSPISFYTDFFAQESLPCYCHPLILTLYMNMGTVSGPREDFERPFLP